MPSSYSAGKYSIEQLITNNTDQTWRPLPTLAPGQTEEVTAYTPDYAGIKV